MCSVLSIGCSGLGNYRLRKTLRLRPRPGHFVRALRITASFARLNHKFPLVTLISAAIIFTFTTVEFFDYRRVGMDTSIVVDKSRGQALTVWMNVTFPRVPCYRAFAQDPERWLKITFHPQSSVWMSWTLVGKSNAISPTRS